jgi:hypothetical protein
LKKFCLIVLSIALVMSMTVTAFAALPDAASYADPKPTQKSTDGGFYDITAPDGLTVTPAASSGSVTEKDVDVDDDLTFEKLQAKSDKLNVTLSGATNGAYYVVLLVEGSALPDDASKIYYINQVTASGTTVDFTVFPKEIDADKQTMTLFITSSTGGTVASATMGYCKSGTEHWIKGGTVTIKRGDVDGNGVVEPKDRVILARHFAGWAAYATLDYPDNADVDANGSVEPKDRVILSRYLAGWTGLDAYFQ